jgi:hypothetical protein
MQGINMEDDIIIKKNINKDFNIIYNDENNNDKKGTSILELLHMRQQDNIRDMIDKADE